MLIESSEYDYSMPLPVDTDTMDSETEEKEEINEKDEIGVKKLAEHTVQASEVSKEVAAVSVLNWHTIKFSFLTDRFIIFLSILLVSKDIGRDRCNQN